MVRRRITVFDVAREAGVGKSTAARALRNAPNVSAHVQKKVREAAESLGYRPDPALRLLLQRRSGKRNAEQSGLGIVFLSTARKHHYGLRPGYFLGAQAQAEKMGYRIERWFAEDFKETSKLEKTLWHRGIRGILLDVVYSGEEPLVLDWSRYAAVACGVGERNYPLQTVDANLALTVRTCLNQAVLAGHRRIAVSVFYGGDNEQELLREGALHYAHAHLPEECVVETFSARTAQDSPEKFVRWIRRFKPSIVVGNHSGFLTYLKDGGFSVPANLSLVSINTSTNDCEMSGTLYDSAKIGSAAMELLDIQIQNHSNGNERAEYQLLLPPVWQQGKTLMPLSGQRKVKLPPKAKANTRKRR